MHIAQIKKSRKILKTVANKIEKYPSKYSQTSWCGTACCIAGHIVLSQGARRIPNDEMNVDFDGLECHVRTLAFHILGFNESHAHPIIKDLFKPHVSEGWHVEWSLEYIAAETKKERAKIAADYIRKYVIPKVFPLKSKKL